MDPVEPFTLAWLGLAFGLGLVHAFDADHVAAVSALVSRRVSGRAGVGEGLRWALGHGLVLLGAGVLLFFLGAAIPERYATGADAAAGAVMIVLGGWLIADLIRNPVHIHFHEHDDLGPHAHWHAHAEGSKRRHERDPHDHRHGAVLVGALHGLAGSAPLLVVIPAGAGGRPGFAILYLICFGLGVAVSMAALSGALSRLLALLERRHHGRSLTVLRLSSAVASIGAGYLLLFVGT